MIIYSVIMLVTGYFGEVLHQRVLHCGNLSGAAYFLIVYEIWLGEASKLAAAAGWKYKNTKLYVGSYL
jgi:hypothetical protein